MLFRSRGYVIGGIESTLPQPSSVEAGGRRDTYGEASCAAEKPQREHLAYMARPAPRNPPPIRREMVELAEPVMRRHAAPTARLGLGRAEELGVIERFLTERGATRCPDLATIERSPLPTLVWDKLKRKWVRPVLSDREAS